MDNNHRYLTTYRDDYRNPNSLSIKKTPPKPPQWTINSNGALNPCDTSSQSTSPAQQKPIDFECYSEDLLGKLHGLNDKGQKLETALHDRDCPLNKADVMKSQNYSNQDSPVMHCRELKSNNDDCCCPQKDALNKRHRDPHPFRLFAVEKAPNYASPTAVKCSVPSINSRRNTFGISEYKDTISKSGKMSMLAVQQYTEPTPSSRRRLDGQCIQTC